MNGNMNVNMNMQNMNNMSMNYINMVNTNMTMKILSGRLDTHSTMKMIIPVRYHCGGWSEEVNSCILNSYMVYL